VRRRAVVGATLSLALLLAACSTPEVGSDPGAPTATSTASPVPTGLSALDDPAAAGLPRPLIDVSELRSGGPPPDGIPAIDEPRFVTPAAADWLTEDEPVLVLETTDGARIYPVQIMIWHEIVNDVVDGRPVAVTYCPLCNSALAFSRRIGGQVLTFGTSGLLYNSDLVMYDRQTESLWPQLELRAVAGRLTGTELDPVVLSTLPWSQARETYPSAEVLSRETGFTRDYGSNPYIGYDDEDSDPFLFDGEPDARLPAKAQVVGLFRDSAPAAVPVSDLVEGPLLVAGPEGAVLLRITSQAASPLDREDIASGRLVPTVAAYAASIGGRPVELVLDGDGVRDRATGSAFGPDGVATTGALRGERLDLAESVTTLWFAWAAFQPDTRLVRR
jgi:hypothetical protein